MSRNVMSARLPTKRQIPFFSIWVNMKRTLMVLWWDNGIIGNNEKHALLVCDCLWDKSFGQTVQQVPSCNSYHQTCLLFIWYIRPPIGCGFISLRALHPVISPPSIGQCLSIHTGGPLCCRGTDKYRKSQDSNYHTQQDRPLLLKNWLLRSDQYVL